jgi:hypothetical protein
MVQLQLRKPLMLAGTECYPTVYIRNSYAGESALIVTVGFYRLVCSNGMAVGTVDFKESITHVGKRNADKFSQLANTIKRAVEFSCTQLEAIVERANSCTATEEDIARLLGAMKSSTRLHGRVMDAIRSARPEDRTGPNGSLTMWNVWNILNEQMRKGSRSQVRQLERNVQLANAVVAMAA